MGKRKYLVFSNDVAPARDGMYQREFLTNNTNKWLWSRYSNGQWYCSYGSFYNARDTQYHSSYQTGSCSPYSSLDWRGLAKQPK